MASIFTKIINRELPGHFLYEDEECVVILDKFPMLKGQSLVIPKQEVDYVFDLDDKTYSHIFKVAKKIAKATDKALSPDRTCLVVEGTEVPHVHIKIYPIHGKRLQPFVQIGEEASDEELALVATQIQAATED